MAPARARSLGGLCASVLLGIASAACTSRDGSATTVERVPVYYNSTERQAAAEREAEPAEGERCEHVFAPLSRETHTYADTAFDPPMPAHCTPIRCDKCGIVRHECLKRRRR